MWIDVFNGDADGICALLQLRLQQPRESLRITGVMMIKILNRGALREQSLQSALILCQRDIEYRHVICPNIRR